MTNLEFKKEYKEFQNKIAEYPMLSDAYFKLPALIRFTIFMEYKLGVISTNSLFRVISTFHYEYSNIAASVSVVKDDRQRNYAFQKKNVEIWSKISSQIFNSLNMVSVLGERDDNEYLRMANDSMANLDYFNVYYSLVKYQLNSKIGDYWPELPIPAKLFLATINNFDDDVKIEEYVNELKTEVEETIKSNPDIKERTDEITEIKEFYSAVICSKYISKLEAD